jgi:DNA-binding winged helix-turn-helix (wHTH) protein
MDAGVREGKFYQFGAFVLDPTRRVLTHDSVPVALSSTPFETLLFLVENPGRVVSKDELLDAVWPRRVVDEANVSQTIFTLRKSLAAVGGDQTYIATAPGQGYRFAQPVEVHAHNVAFAGATPLDPPAPSPAISPRRPAPGLSLSLMIAGGVLVLLIAGGVAVWRLRQAPADPGHSLVVLTEFQNLTADPMFNRAVSKAVEIDLDQSPFVTALLPTQVADTLGLMAKPKDTPVTLDVASEICTRNGGQAVIDGAIAPMGSDYLVALAATNCAGDQVLDAEKAQVTSREAVVPALDGLVNHMRSKLGESQGSIDRFSVPLAREKTASLEALEAYSQAAWLVQHGQTQEAIPLYQQAIGLDPNFAVAYAGLAATFYNNHDFQRAADTE